MSIDCSKSLAEQVEEKLGNIHTEWKFYGSIPSRDWFPRLADQPSGTVCHVADELAEYVKISDGHWKEIASVSATEPDFKKTKKINITCKHCGASLPITEKAKSDGYVKCEYCRSLSPVFEYVTGTL